MCWRSFDAGGVPRRHIEGTVHKQAGAWGSEEMMSYERAIREGYFAVASHHVKLLTGRPARSLRQVFEATAARAAGMTRTPEEQRNLDHVLGLFRDVLAPLDADQVERYIAADYIQHSPMAAPGADSSKRLCAAYTPVPKPARNCCAHSWMAITSSFTTM